MGQLRLSYELKKWNEMKWNKVKKKWNHGSQLDKHTHKIQPDAMHGPRMVWGKTTIKTIGEIWI